MNIGIVGVGRFGQLLQKHLSTQHTVFTFTEQQPKEQLQDCELVIYAVPNRLLEQAIEQTKKYIHKDTIVMDVGSVKTFPCATLFRHFSNNILGTHPLFGPDSANESWQNHKMVFCRLTISDHKYQHVKTIFTDLGVSAIETTPEEHDKAMAKTQALVHFIGRALTGLTEQAIATPDYENLLAMMQKVTNDTWELFFDMQKLNPYAAAVRRDFIKQLQELELKITQQS